MGTLLPERETSLVFFHTPQGNTRGVCPSVPQLPVSNLTLCAWVRTNDDRGALLSYSANTTGGTEFAVFTMMNATAKTNLYVCQGYLSGGCSSLVRSFFVRVH